MLVLILHTFSLFLKGFTIDFHADKKANHIFIFICHLFYTVLIMSNVFHPTVELGRKVLGEQTINLQILPGTFCAKGSMSQEFLGLPTVSLRLVSFLSITAGFSSLDIHPKASSSCRKMFESINFLFL